MSIKIAVRVSYPETNQYDWHDALAQYVDIGAVAVAFYRTCEIVYRRERWERRDEKTVF